MINENMISKTSTYFLALAMFTSETAFGLSLESKPSKDINNMVRSRSTYDQLAQVNSKAFAKQAPAAPEVTVAPETTDAVILEPILEIEDPNGQRGSRRGSRPRSHRGSGSCSRSRSRSHRGSKSCSKSRSRSQRGSKSCSKSRSRSRSGSCRRGGKKGDTEVCLNLGNPWNCKRYGAETKQLGILVDSSCCRQRPPVHCHLPHTHIGCCDHNWWHGNGGCNGGCNGAPE